MAPNISIQHFLKQLALLVISPLLLGLSTTSQGQVTQPQLSQAQQDYLDAYKAIKRNDRQAISEFKRKLKEYPLAIYLNYHDYRLHLKETPKERVLDFIKKNKDSYLSRKLYNHWLKYLATNHHWTTFLTHYSPQNDQNIQCLHIQALANRGKKAQAIKLAQPIWKNTLTLSKSCKPIDKLLRKNNKLTGSMIWHRIKLAMNKRKTKLAKKLSLDLSRKEQKMFSYWLIVYKEPELVAKPLPRSIAPIIKKEIFIQGIRKLASSNPKLANNSLEKFYKQYGFNKSAYEDLKRKVALRTAYKYAPQAWDFLKEVNDCECKTEESLRWQAQVALKQSDWGLLLASIDLMPEAMQKMDQWQYWKARALEATGDKKINVTANRIYRKLAKKRNYYGFLSADKQGLDYRFNPNPVEKQSTAYLINKYPELRRIAELIAIEWPVTANREWYHLLNRVDSDELQAIALLAHEWQQHAQAIRSLAKAKQWHALELRFPTPHKGPVMLHADKHKIDPAWIYGVMRRESAFSEDIKSPVGAVGLMQIMPKTAKYIGKKIGVDKGFYNNLTNAQNNIELGSAYLGYLSVKFKENKVMATAAYNAGPGRVYQWQPKGNSIAADQWIDAIPFTETRKYVKAVLEYMTIFHSVLNHRYDRLSDIMPPIPPRSSKK